MENNKCQDTKDEKIKV